MFRRSYVRPRQELAYNFLMLWFYVTGLAFLVGGEVNSVIEHAADEHGRPEAKAEGSVSGETVSRIIAPFRWRKTRPRARRGAAGPGIGDRYAASRRLGRL